MGPDGLAGSCDMRAVCSVAWALRTGNAQRPGPRRATDERGGDFRGRTDRRRRRGLGAERTNGWLSATAERNRVARHG